MRKISELLSEKRKEKELTLADVEQSTKIRKIYLEAIENGRFKDLPSESYALGFVKNYASFLDIPASVAVPLFRREYELKHAASIVPEFRKSQHKFNKKFFLNSKAILIAGVFLVLGIYVSFQYSSLLFAPKLKIESPKNGATIDGNVVEVSGETDPYATVKIGGEEVYVDLSGEFKKSIYVFSGDNKINIVATNRFGKDSKEELTITAK